MWNLDGDRGGGGGKNTVKGFVPTLLPPLQQHTNSTDYFCFCIV